MKRLVNKYDKFAGAHSSLVMLVVVGFLILAFTGGVLSGRKSPPSCGMDEPSCPKDQHYTEKDQTCLKTCANRLVAGGRCKPYTGCICNDGLVRLHDDATGPCVPEKKCLPRCQKNEHYVTEDQDCVKTCGNRLLPGANTAGACVPYTGCVCDAGYVRKYDNRTGPCIPEKTCPRIPKECGKNEYPTSCRIKCPPQTCDSIFTTYDCPEPVCEPGCDCIDGYLRNPDGVCIPSDDCFKPDPIECGPNEVLSDCKQVCPPQSCESLYTTYLCALLNCTVGCNCIDGFLRNRDGVCIPSEKCSEEPCNGDLNATHVDCGSACAATCAQPDTNRPCILSCVLNGCKCKPGYILTEQNGVCISPNDCPGGSPNCAANQTYVQCKVGCPTNYCPADDNRAMVACSMPYPCPGGCACNQGYLIESRDNPRCILSEECPPVQCTRPNEIWDPKPSNCYFESCEDIGRECDNKYAAPPRCVCQRGYYRNASDVCVPASECPDLGCNGDLNATYNNCTSACPASCADRNLEGGGRACIDMCKPPGCACKPGYIFDDYGKCIKPEDCPEPGCNGDPNAVHSDCPSACQPTCANSTTEQPCIAMCLESGCVCKPGYILTEKGGKCIKMENCPAEPQCNGDRNATFKTCPSPCQATCDKPDTDRPCIEICLKDGCVCKQGYLRIKEKGQCISPSDCPGGSPTCGVNQTYVYCKVGCPDNYCPVDNNLAEVACDPIFPCPGGCACEGGYLRISYKDDRCILSSECPPVECTRPNEVWEPKPPRCIRERCSDIDSDTGCNYYNPNLPRCVCKKGYFRNDSNICVPASQCHPSTPICGVNEIARDCRRICPPQTCFSKYALFRCKEDIPCEPGCDCIPNYLRDKNGVCIRSEDCPPLCGIPDECKRTCATPNPPNCDYQEPPKSNIDGCDCKQGYILSEIGGDCIKIEDCPTNLGCNGDPHARTTLCPHPCPSTCEAPNASPCKRMCDPIGCSCEDGYLLSNMTGRCILPEECPGGNPCGKSGRFVQCKVNCPQEYCPVDDSRDIIICDPPNKCLSGCICTLNHKKKSYKDPRCIVSSDCPPVRCTRPNEVWSSCPSACLAENCEDVMNQPTTCNTLVLNCEPACICKKNHFRNASGICIPARDCPC